MFVSEALVLAIKRAWDVPCDELRTVAVAATAPLRSCIGAEPAELQAAQLALRCPHATERSRRRAIAAATRAASLLHIERRRRRAARDAALTHAAAVEAAQARHIQDPPRLFADGVAPLFFVARRRRRRRRFGRRRRQTSGRRAQHE